MFKRLKDNFMEGAERLRWFATVFSDRSRVGIATMKLMHNAEEVKRRREGLLKELGQRTYELRGETGANVLKDTVVLKTFAEIEAAEREIEELESRISGINSDGI
jgi:hypothetical protein